MLDLAQNGRRRCRPDEWARVLVVFAYIGANCSDESRHAAEGSAPDPLARDLGEEALDKVQPRGAGGGEVEVKPRMLGHPRLHGRMLVGTVVVQDQMDVAPAGGLPLDLVQEGEKFGVRMAGLARLDHMPLEDIESGEQRGRAVA